MKSAEQIAKVYEPGLVEERIYQNWEKKGYFRGVIRPDRKPYTIVIPPPNITGQLHMGHALDNTLQDILIRFKRMQGYSALWLPGTDHASIATEAKIVEAMRKEGLSKEDVGRDGFLKRAWAWKEQYGSRIIQQLKKLGSSCDWSRERFTMDDGCSKAVREVFVRLYQKGYIYRGERMINWCPHCLTSISDAEVEYEEQTGHFWHLRYPLTDGSGYLELATTRPETLLGDTAVAVHPQDERYQAYVGKTVTLPLVGREIPVVADEYVDREFGTGVVKITPAHDPNDFEVGVRHNLPVINVMTDDARITEEYPAYAGMGRYEARKAIVADLETGGFLLKTEEHIHNVGTCYRCGTTVEPRVSLQWFVKMEELAKPAIRAVREKRIRFVPERFEKNYFHWMENIRDWCISRQLWWGHRIPAYYCDACGEMAVSKEPVKSCPVCGKVMRQDEDTLDTWFSSALWPFSTLGWPEQTADLAYFYPTSTLVTGYDIITFWVSRMIFSALEYTGEIPFETVLIHGLVRDSQGRKMSKSLGNGIDPLEVIEQFGTDALRFSLTTGNSPGNDQRFLQEKVEAARNFANKIWNATRFVLLNFDENPDFSQIDFQRFTIEDKWILSGVNRLVQEVTDNLNKFELGVALSKVYDFIWDRYCDWYIELVKPRLFDPENGSRLEAQYVLNTVLVTCMKLLHPFMPFITEEIYQNLVKDCESIMISSWPLYQAELSYPQEEEEMSLILDAIRSIRNIRAQMTVPPSRKAHVIFVTAPEKVFLFANAKPYLMRLAYAADVSVQITKEGIPEDAAAAAVEGAEIFLPLEDLIDFAKEIERLEKEKRNLEGELNRVTAKLANEGFLAKAPQKVVEEERAKREKFHGMYQSVSERLAALKQKK